MRRRQPGPPGLLLGLFWCLLAASAGHTLGGSSFETPACASPQRCPSVIARTAEAVTYTFLDTAVSTLVPTPTNLMVTTIPGNDAPCLMVTSLAATLDPAELDFGSVLEAITSLSSALVSASSGAVSLSQQLSTSLSDLEASSSSLEASASNAVLAAKASASDAVSRAEASASRAESAAQASASRRISQALASATSAEILATSTAREQVKNEKMSSELSTTVAAIAIAVSGVGSSLVSLLAVWLFMRRRRAKQRANEEEKEVNAALDRAIVSYIVKEQDPSSQDGQSPGQDRLNPREPTMTNALGPIPPVLEGDRPPGPRRVRTEPPAAAEESRDFIRRTQSSRTTERTREINRRTASSCFTDDAEQVYGDILARPLESVASRPSSRPPEVVPAARRDDVGWPLTKDSWL